MSYLYDNMYWFQYVDKSTCDNFNTFTLLRLSGVIRTDPKEVPEIASWELEAALRDMTNGTATGNDHVNIETLKAG